AVELTPGDRLLLTLRATGFERAVYSEGAEFRDRPWKNAGPWRVGLLDNRLSARNTAEWLVSIEDFESLRPTEDGILRQVKPRFVWVETKPQAGEYRARGQHWGNADGYPAPAFRIQTPDWPTYAVPVARAWIGQSPQAFRTIARDPGRELA